MPFDKPLYGAFNASLIEIGFRGGYIKHEIYCILFSHLCITFDIFYIVIKHKDTLKKLEINLIKKFTRRI